MSIVIVSGLPRSGTSLMMQILQSAGIPIATDKKRRADENNPKGYLEIDNIIRKIRTRPEYIFNYDGKAIKITSPGVPYLPFWNYKVIYMERNIDEVLDSMEKMIGLEKDPNREITRKGLLKLDKKARDIINRRSDMERLYVNYNSLIKFPKLEVQRVQKFLSIDEEKLDKMVKCIDKSLYRSRHC